MLYYIILHYSITYHHITSHFITLYYIKYIVVCQEWSWPSDLWWRDFHKQPGHEAVVCVCVCARALFHRSSLYCFKL